MRWGLEIAADGRVGLAGAPAREEAEAAFAGLMERQARLMFRVAMGVVRDRAAAEDVVQEAALKLFRAGSWRAAESERAFVARAVWRVAVSRRKTLRQNAPEDLGELEIAAEGETAEQGMVQAGERARLWQLIDGLPMRLRQPLVLNALEEMTSAEVGAVMGIPEGTVRTRVMRAKAELRRRYEATERRRR